MNKMRKISCLTPFIQPHLFIVKFDVDVRPGADAVDKQALDMPKPLTNNFGTAGKVDPNSWWGEGGVISRIANQIPSINAIAGLHDVFQVRLEQWGGVLSRNVFNVPGMPLAAGMTWMALRDSEYLTYDSLERIAGRSR